MLAKYLLLPSMLVLLSFSAEGCELQALMDAGLACSAQENTRFNLTKYFTYIDYLITEGSKYDSAEAFLYANTFRDMVDHMGELEPAIVWLMDSFYVEHFKSRDKDTWIRPMFGDMTNMDKVLSNAMTSHCGIMKDLNSCFEAELQVRCSKKKDADDIVKLFVTPLHERYCSGDSSRQSVLDWFTANSKGLTNAFRCLIKDPDAKTFEFIDFEKKIATLNVDIDRILGKCNANAFGSVGIVEFYEEDLKDIMDFENFNMSTFNIMDIVNADIPSKFFPLVRPMGDCFIEEFKRIGQRFCPKLTINDEIQKFMKTMKQMFPIYTEEQDYIGEMVLNPEKVDIGGGKRFSAGVFGGSHIYHGNSDTWYATCSDFTKGALPLLAVNHFAFYKDENGTIVLKPFWGDATLEFSADSTDIRLTKSYDSETKGKLDMLITTESNTGYILKVLGLTTSVNIRLELESNRIFISVSELALEIAVGNPSGENWVILVRGSTDSLRLASGAIAGGCKSSTDAVDAIKAIDVDPSCKTKCATAGALEIPCGYECTKNKDNKANMISELAALEAFNKYFSRRDSDSQNAALNRDGGTYNPCGMLGFGINVAIPCGIRSIASGTLPDFSYDSTIDFISDMGIVEPYTFYAMASFYEKWVIATGKQLAFDDSKLDDIKNMIKPETMKSIFKSHCSFIMEITQCMSEEVDSFCPSSKDDLKSKYFAPLSQRYCTDGNTTKDAVIEAMMTAREEMTAPLKCFLDLSQPSIDFNSTKVETFVQLVVDNCAVEDLMFFVTQLFEGNSGKEDVLQTLEKLLRIVKGPGRCVLRVIESLCPGTEVRSALKDLFVHINRATANTLPSLSLDTFYPEKKPNFGSLKRSSVWAVGDPHIKEYGETKFSVCDSPGERDYFINTESPRMSIKGVNSQVREGINATVITKVTVKFYAENADFGAKPIATYEASDGKLAKKFLEGTDNVVREVDGNDASITVEYREALNVVVVRDVATGTMLAIAPFKNFFNLVLRGNSEYIGSGSGLLVSGCADKKEALIEPRADSDARRRKRDAPTQEECEASCQKVPQPELLESCTYDCYVTEDTEMADAHVAVVSVEETVVEDDTMVLEWFPATTSIPFGSASSLTMSFTVLSLAALLLFS